METDGSPYQACIPGFVRAAVKLASAPCEKGQNLTRNRLITRSSKGVENGHRTSFHCLITSRSARYARFATSFTESQFCSRLGRASPNRLASVRIGSHKRLYELMKILVQGELTHAISQSVSWTSYKSLRRSETITTSNSLKMSNGSVCASASTK